MQRHRAAFLLLPASLFLAGCGGSGGWMHAKKSSSQFAEDNASCEQQAIEKVTGSHQKHDAPKWLTRSVGTKTYTQDANNSLRNRWQHSCLVRMGWRRESSESHVGAASTELVDAGRRLIGQ